MVTHFRKKKLALLALLFAALPSATYASGECSDMPGYHSVPDRDIRMIGNVVKIWLLDLPKTGRVDYKKTLESLIKSKYYDRSDYYAVCTTKEPPSNYSIWYQCTNRHGKVYESPDDTFPDKNGLPMSRFHVGESGGRYSLCKTNQEVYFGVDLLKIGGKLLFMMDTSTYSPPSKIKRNAPSPSDYRF